MIDLTARYPGQSEADPDYPQGKARNRTAPGMATGTPFEADLVNDIHGALQAIVEEGGLSISGVPDSAAASDVLDALMSILAQRTGFGNYTPTLSALSNITGASSQNAFYVRIGTVVFVALWVSYTNAATGGKSFRATLPIEPTADFASNDRAIGICSVTVPSDTHDAGHVTSIVGADPQVVSVQWYNTESSGVRSVLALFGYTIE